MKMLLLMLDLLSQFGNSAILFLKNVVVELYKGKPVVKHSLAVKNSNQGNGHRRSVRLAEAPLFIYMLSKVHIFARSTLHTVSADGLRSFVGPAVDIIAPSSVEDMKVIQCQSFNNCITNINFRLTSQENFIGAASSFVEKRTEYHLLRLLSAGTCSTAELSDRFTQAGAT